MKQNINYKKELTNLLATCLGGVILVIGVNLFLKPAGVYATGLFGFAQELSILFFNNSNYINLIFWLLNLPLIVFGFFKVGKKFLLRTICAVISITISESLINTNTVLIQNQFLSVVFGALLCGLGTGLALSRGGSTGGTDIIATYISIIKGKNFGIVNVLVNSIVVLLAILITKNIEVGVYMLISIYVSGIVIDKIHNYNQKMTLFIVTNHKDNVVNSITNNFMRGVTIIDSMGGYSKKPNNLIMVTVSKKEVNSIVRYIKQADPHCFINIYKVEKLMGSFKDTYVEML